MTNTSRSGSWIATAALLAAMALVVWLSIGPSGEEPPPVNPLERGGPDDDSPRGTEPLTARHLPSDTPDAPPSTKSPAQPAAPKPRRMRVHGQVLDRGGEPLPGAVVRCAPRAQSAGLLRVPLEQAPSTRSGPRGRFAFEGVSAAAAQYVVAEHRNHGTVWSGPHVAPTTGALDVGTLTLPAGGAVQGVVRDEDGDPIEGALVDEYFPAVEGAAEGVTDVVVALPVVDPASVLTPALRRRLHIGRQRRTNAAGEFAFTGLAVGSFVVRARRNGYAPVARRVEVGADHSVPVVLRLPAAHGVIEGRVEDEYGRPLIGAFVHAAPIAPTAPAAPAAPLETTPVGTPVPCDLPQANARTDAGGGYRLTGLAGSRFHVSVSAFDHLPAERADVSAGAQRVDFTLAQAGRLEGRTVDARTHKPVRGALVEAFELDPDGFTISVHGQRGPAPPTSDGTWILTGLRPGTYRVVGRAPGFAESRTEAIVVGASEAVRDITLPLEAGGSIEGQVVAARDGTPLSGVHVQLDNRERHPPAGLIVPEAGVRTDTEGRFRLEHLPVGPGRLLLQHPGRVVDSLEVIHVRSGTTTRGVTVRMWEAARLEGLVEGASARSPTTWVELTRLPAGMPRSAPCDVEGRFVFSGLLPGRHRVLVRGAPPGERDPEAYTIEVTEGARQQIELPSPFPEER